MLFVITEVRVYEQLAYFVLSKSKLIISCSDFFVELCNPLALIACEYLFSQIEEHISDSSS